jgi:hypothetical protein
MVLYSSLGLLRKGRPEEALRITCNGCDYCRNKKTGSMRIDGLSEKEAQEWLTRAVDEPLLVISLGPIGRMVASELHNGNGAKQKPFYGENAARLARYVSEVQTKQKMNTCMACGSFTLQALQEKNDTGEPVIIL